MAVIALVIVANVFDAKLRSLVEVPPGDTALKVRSAELTQVPLPVHLDECRVEGLALALVLPDVDGREDDVAQVPAHGAPQEYHRLHEVLGDHDQAELAVHLCNSQRTIGPSVDSDCGQYKADQFRFQVPQTEHSLCRNFSIALVSFIASSGNPNMFAFLKLKKDTSTHSSTHSM